MTVQRRQPRPATARAAALVAAALAVGVNVGGCSMFSEQTTQNVGYAPSDGVQAEVGPILVRNFILLSPGEGEPAILIGSLFNTSDEDVEVLIGVASGEEPQVYEVPAVGSLTIGPEAEEQLRVESIGVVPGLLAQVAVVSGGAEAVLDVPVLDGSLPGYAELVPDATAG